MKSDWLNRDTNGDGDSLNDQLPVTRALREVRNPGCPICRMQGAGCAHWAWHDFVRAEVNPVALLEFIDRASTVGQVRAYLIAVTGLDEAKLKAWRRFEGGGA